MDRNFQGNSAKGHVVSRSEDPIPSIDPSRNLLPELPKNDPRSNRNLHQGKPVQRTEANEIEEESNILVAVRVRPMIAREIGLGDMDIIRVEDNLIVRINDFK